MCEPVLTADRSITRVALPPAAADDDYDGPPSLKSMKTTYAEGECHLCHTTMHARTPHCRTNRRPPTALPTAAADKVEPTVDDAKHLGQLFAACAASAGGAHAALRGDSFNESTILAFPEGAIAQTLHADYTVPSLAAIYNASKEPVMGPEFLDAAPVTLSGVGIKTTTPAGRSVHARPVAPHACSTGCASLTRLRVQCAVPGRIVPS